MAVDGSMLNEYIGKKIKIIFVNEQGTLKGTLTKDGKKFANCVSLQSGKIFNFTGLVDQTYYKFSKGTIFKVYFYGNGNRNLTLETFDYIR